MRRVLNWKWLFKRKMRMKRASNCHSRKRQKHPLETAAKAAFGSGSPAGILGPFFSRLGRSIPRLRSGIVPLRLTFDVSSENSLLRVDVAY